MKKEKARLPCDDIHDFINGIKHYYGVNVSDKFMKEEVVTLYNHDTECDFVIKIIFCIDGIKKLGLVKS